MRLSLCARAARRNYHRQHSTGSAHVHTCIIVSPHTHRHKARKTTQQKTPKRSRFEEESSAKRQVRCGGWMVGMGVEGGSKRTSAEVVWYCPHHRDQPALRPHSLDVEASTVQCGTVLLRALYVLLLYIAGPVPETALAFCVCVCVCVYLQASLR